MKNLLHYSLMPLTFAFGSTDAAGAGVNQPKSIAEAANSAWNQALNSRNATALAALYAEGAIVSPGDGKTLVGRADIENLFKSFIDNGVHGHTIDIIDTSGSGNLIQQVARWDAKGAETDGKTPHFGGILTSVLEKNPDGKWLIRSHIWNVAN